MPTYQYECAACSHQFEILQSMTEKRLKKCPKCRKIKLTRLIGSGSGIIFKGSGFYETDYKRKGSSPEPSKPNPDKPEPKSPDGQGTKTTLPAAASSKANHNSSSGKASVSHNGACCGGAHTKIK